MPKASELKRGSVVALNGKPHVVEEVRVQTPSARGASSLYKVRFRNLLTRSKDDRTFKGEDALTGVHVEKREVQFSYIQQDTYVFLDLEDYSEVRVNEQDLEAQKPYLSEGLEGICALISDGRVLTIELPDTVALEIAQCDPSMRGASATARTKPATLSTGLIVQVPEHLAPSETIRVDTRTGDYLGRA